MKIAKSLMFLMMVAMLFGACDEDPVAVNENEVPDGIIQQNYTFTVHVLASSENGRAAGLKNATVTVSQNANVKSIKVNESGEAVFKNLVSGVATVFVKAEGFASYNNTSVVLTPLGTTEELIVAEGGNDGNHVIVSGRALQVTLPRLGASVKGHVVADTDKNPATALAPATGFKVRLQYPATIQPNLYFANVAADGSYQFTNVPEYTGVTISTDTIITITNQTFMFSYSATVNPRVGGTNVDLFEAGNLDVVIPFTGTYKFKPYGDFDFGTPSTAGFQPTSEIPAATVVFTIDYSADGPYPNDLNQVFSGVRDANGVWTFSNLPAGTYTGKIKYSFTQTYNETAGGNLIVPATGFTFVPGTTYGAGEFDNSGTATVAYTRTITWNDVQGGGNVVNLNPNETKDDGPVRLVE